MRYRKREQLKITNNQEEITHRRDDGNERKQRILSLEKGHRILSLELVI